MKRITLKRIYQGKVSAVQIPDGKGEWKKLDDGESALWQHHQLFQDAVNYYAACLAALADSAPGWAGEYAAQVQGTEKGKWDDFTKKGEKRSGLRKSLARTFGISKQDASFLVCRSRILAGCEASKDLLHQVVQELFPEKKGRGTIQHAGTGDWPMLCWKDWEGESKAEKKIRKESGQSSFLNALFSCEQDGATELAAASTLEQSALTSLAKGRPDLVGEKARQELEAAAKSLADELQRAAFKTAFRKHARLSEEEVAEALSSLAAEIKSRGESFVTPPWTGGNKDMTPIRFFLLFKFVPTNPLTLSALKAYLRKPHIGLLRRTVKPFTLSNLKHFLRDAKGLSRVETKPTDDAIRKARGSRGFVFPAFTAIAGWGVQPGEFAWKNFDMAAFEEALKSPHQTRQKNQERQKERADALETVKLMEGRGKVRRASDSDETENIPGFKDDERIIALKRIVETDLVDENVAAGGEYGIHERTLRGYGELRRLWNEKVQPGEKYSKDKHEKLAKILRDYQTTHRDDSGDPNLFAELLKERNWCIWQTPTDKESEKHAELNHSEDPLRDYQRYLELKADAERLKDPIEFTPADARLSRRQFFFSDGEKFSASGKYTHERNALAFTTQIARKMDGRWQPVRVRIAYTAPRLRRDALRQDSDEQLDSSKWISPLLRALGISEPKEVQDFSCCSVALMPDWDAALPPADSPPDKLLLNFPVDLEFIELQRAIYAFRDQAGDKFFKTRENPQTKKEEPQTFWDYQFGGRKESKKFMPMWLSWPHEGREAKEFGLWHGVLPSFRCLSTDLGQRDAGAFARLLASCKNDFGKRPSRNIGTTDGKLWRAVLERSGLFRLSGEDAQVWREQSSRDELDPEDSGKPFDFREELWGERGRPARDWEAADTADLMRLLEAIETDTDGKEKFRLLPDDWRDTLSFPEQNQKLVVAARQYLTRISRLHRWCWFLGMSEAPMRLRALREIRKSVEMAQMWGVAKAETKPERLKKLHSLIRDTLSIRLQQSSGLLVRIANRVLPLRGRSWHWENHPTATEQNTLHHLTQRGPSLDSKEKPVWLRGQRGLSLKRIEQIEDLRTLFQRLNQMQRRRIGQPPPIRRDESVPDPCPDLLDKLDNIKEQRVNQTAHMILTEALGLRLAQPPANKKTLLQEKDQHGVYEKLLDKKGGWIGPVDFVVIEDLSRYRATQGRAPRENSRLMKWCHRAVRDKLKQLCEVFGLPVLETPAAYSSRFCSRSGVPGFRAEELNPDMKQVSPWAWQLKRLADFERDKAKMDEDDRKKAESKLDEARKIKRLFDNLDEINADTMRERERARAEKRPFRPKWRTLFAPTSGGPVFVPVVERAVDAEIDPTIVQADINAAINLALRAIADPNDWRIHLRLRTQRDKKDGSLSAREKRKFGEKEKVELTVTSGEKPIKDGTRNPNFFADFAALKPIAETLAEKNHELNWLIKEWTSAEIPGASGVPALIHGKSFWGCVKANQWKRIQAINEARISAWKDKLNPMPD